MSASVYRSMNSSSSSTAIPTCFLQSWGAALLSALPIDLSADTSGFLTRFFIFPYIAFNFCRMVMEITQRVINLGQGQILICVKNLLECFPKPGHFDDGP